MDSKKITISVECTEMPNGPARVVVTQLDTTGGETTTATDAPSYALALEVAGCDLIKLGYVAQIRGAAEKAMEKLDKIFDKPAGETPPVKGLD